MRPCHEKYKCHPGGGWISEEGSRSAIVYPPPKFITRLLDYFFIVLLTLLPMLLSGQQEQWPGDPLLWEAWTVADQLPHNQVNCCVQTTDGFLWFGTPAGLARFDGVHFKIYTAYNTPALKSNHITALYVDAKGMLWIGTEQSGLYSLYQKQWQHYSSQQGLSHDHIRAITGDWQGNIWVGTDYGLNRISGNEITHYTTADGLAGNVITALARDYQGGLWVGTLQHGVTQIKHDIFRIYDHDEGLTDLRVLSVYTDQHGALWIGTMGGLYVKDWNRATMRSIPGSNYMVVTTLTVRQPAGLWVGTLNVGLFILQGDQLERLQPDRQFSDQTIRCLMSDRQGLLWCGTETEGLIQLRPALVTKIDTQNRLPDDPVVSVYQDSGGLLWLGTRDSGLVCLQEQQVVRRLNQGNGLSSNQIRAITADAQGWLWVGTATQGINILTESKILTLNEQHGLLSNQIRDIITDDQKQIWVATVRGLQRFQKHENNYSPDRIFKLPHINLLYKAAGNRLWIGTQNGVFTIKQDQIKKRTPDSLDTELDVSALYADAADTLWIGTDGFGLKRWAAGQLVTLSTMQGLPSNHIFSIQKDRCGYLWLSSYKGVFGYNQPDLNTYLDCQNDQILPLRFDTWEGLPSQQCTRIGNPSSWQTPTGAFYYPTLKGVACLRPDLIKPEARPPTPILEALQVNGRTVAHQDSCLILPPQARVGFIFTAIDFRAPHKLSFRYRLQGWDRDVYYVTGQDSRRVDYEPLKPGAYRFILQATGNYTRLFSEPVTIRFRVRRPFYRTPLFIGGLLMGLILLGGAMLYFYRARHRRKKSGKYQTTLLTTDQVKTVLPQLERLMEQEKLFLDPNLSLPKLAQRLHINANHLSRIINEHFKLNFNDYINRYRLAEARKKLTDPRCQDQTILEIMYTVGFNSKSVFNTLFKKHTGQTPSRYRKNKTNFR